MKKPIALAALALAISSCANIDNVLNTTENSPQNQPITTITSNSEKDLVTLRSPHSVQDTADKLKSLIESKGMKVFATVDHQQNATGTGLTLRPTQVILFGNPKAGTPLMQCEQTVAIDLPQKILIHEDAQGRVWLSYNNPEYLKSRHHIRGCDTVITNISMALMSLSTAATAK